MQKENKNQKNIITGVLLDVSGSMKSSVNSNQFNVNNKQRQWAESIFTVVNDLIKHDISDNNYIFTLTFGGALKGYQCFNLLSVLQLLDRQKHTQNSNNQDQKRVYRRQQLKYRYGMINEEFKMKIVDELSFIVSRNGAPYINKWIDSYKLMKIIKFDQLLQIILQLQFNPQFLKFFISILPKQCKQMNFQDNIVSNFTFFLPIQKQIGEIHRKITQYLSSQQIKFLKNSKIQKIYSVKSANYIIHSLLKQKSHNQNNNIQQHQLKNLLRQVQRFIYGGTPFTKAYQKALQLFNNKQYNQFQKVLFIISDGMPDDKQFLKYKRDPKIKIVSCYITNQSNIKPHVLYSHKHSNWQQGAKLMFDLSSTIRTSDIPRSIFLKNSWKIQQNQNNQSKLFIQANHPENIKSICQLTRNLFQCQEALSEIISDIDIDVYINQNLKSQQLGKKLQQQIGGTCYAHATSSVLHLAMKRIIGRQGGYPDLKTVRDNIINDFGSNGAITHDVLIKKCPQYRLHCKKISSSEAKQAITMKRPVVATFWLNQKQWTQFSSFFDSKKNGILTGKILNITQPQIGQSKDDGGHAVVLVSYCKEYLYFMNSWGTNWADGGFFRVKDNDVLKCNFFDVYWTLNDLTKSQNQYFKKYGALKSKQLMGKLQSLSKAKIKCKCCGKQSLVTSFKGTVTDVICPLCHKSFQTKGQNILALAIYLNSISNNN